MPTFCRHNRFMDRCPICRESVPGLAEPKPRGGRRTATDSARKRAPQRRGGGSPRARGAAASGLRVYADGAQRGREDGYRCALVPGLRSSEDARRLAGEIAFADARLTELGSDPPGRCGQARRLAGEGDLGAAIRLCVQLACMRSPEGEVSPASIEAASERVLARFGEPSWSPQRRFERLFERLALPGLSRAVRFELLSTLGALGLCELAADSLHLAAAAAGDPVPAAAKRVFGIGDALNLERRAQALTEQCGLRLDALDLALSNWSRPAGTARDARGARVQAGEGPQLVALQAALGL